MDNQQLMAQMLMGQMGQQPQMQGGMQANNSTGQSVLQGGGDLLKMLMLQKMMGQQQPYAQSPNNANFAQSFQQQNPASLGVTGPSGALGAVGLLNP
jgi:hypothetical protein